MPARVKPSKPQTLPVEISTERLEQLLDRIYSAALLTGKDATYGRYEGVLEATRAMGFSIARTSQGRHRVDLNADT